MLFLFDEGMIVDVLISCRVLQVVKHFREKESKAPKNTSSNAPPTPSKSEGAADTPASTVVMADTETADKPISTEVVQQDAEEKAPEHEEMHHNAEQAESKQAEVEDSDPFGISADEAAMMKKKFIGACRCVVKFQYFSLSILLMLFSSDGLMSIKIVI
jgi:cytoskeletal protein RodZ